MKHIPLKEHVRSYCIHKIEWRGVQLEIEHMPSWSHGMDHIEIRSENRVPIPITETGYKSLFVATKDIEVTSDPVAYVLAWLDHEACSDEWKCKAVEQAQLSLF